MKIDGDEPDPVLKMMAAYVARFGEAPGVDRIYGAADFRQPGGIGRLCAALDRVAQLMADDRRSGVS